VAGVRIAGSHALQVTLAADPPFAERLAVGLSGLDVSDLAEELSLEAVGEFLNIVAGNTVAVLDDAAVELCLSPPTYGVLPTSGFRFPVVGHIANALLILEPEDPRV
jgi:CheY-specific phosphatase CheX